jgi:hypothetical protein
VKTKNSKEKDVRPNKQTDSYSDYIRNILEDRKSTKGGPLHTDHGGFTAAEQHTRKNKVQGTLALSKA